MLKLTAFTFPLLAARSTRSTGLVGGHRQRLLAYDVATGLEDQADLGVMQMIRRRDVDDFDAVVAEHLLDAVIPTLEAELLRARSGSLWVRRQEAVNVHAEAPKSLDVHGADEAAANDGRSDLAGGPHARSDPVWRNRSRGNCTWMIVLLHVKCKSPFPTAMIRQGES